MAQIGITEFAWRGAKLPTMTRIRVWWTQDEGAQRHRRSSGHSHHTRTSIALGMTMQAYASTTVIAQWLGWCFSHALGVVNGVVGRLVGKVPQAFGG